MLALLVYFIWRSCFSIACKTSFV